MLTIDGEGHESRHKKNGEGRKVVYVAGRPGRFPIVLFPVAPSAEF
jgi:hypothetical protein